MRRRLTVAIAGVATLAVVLFAIPLAVLVGRAYRDEALLRLERDTIAATRSIDVRQPGADPVELPRTGDRLGVYDVAGRRVAGTGPPRADRMVQTTLRTGKPVDRRRGGALLVAVPLLSDERVAGAVLALRDEAAATADVHQAWLLLAAVGLMVLGGAVLAARVVATRMARPMERVAGAATRLGDGDFSVRATSANIAEVDAIATALDATARRLGALVSRERAFTADASHQLRTPLAALRLELEALQLRAGSAELDAAVREVDRLQLTIDTLLAVARDVPRSREPAPVAGLLDDLRDRWAGRLALVSRPLAVECEPPDLRVRASLDVVGEILDVLLSNADVHGAGAVTLRARAVRGHVAIEVGDEGAGFGEPAEHAFARRVGSGEGHGIGLALARSLADAERGRLEIVHPGPEPVVRITLPGG